VSGPTTWWRPRISTQGTIKPEWLECCISVANASRKPRRGSGFPLNSGRCRRAQRGGTYIIISRMVFSPIPFAGYGLLL